MINNSVSNKKYKYALDLQTFNDEVIAMPEEGVEDVPAAEEQTSDVVESKTDVAFAKRLSAAQEKWQAEKEAEIQSIKDQYKDHDVYKKVAEFTQKVNGYDNIMTVKEQIELQELQERAEEMNLSPNQLKRMEELESIAAEFKEVKSQLDQEKEVQAFEQTLKEFSEGKEIDGNPVDHKELWKYMHENQVANPDIAFKAMKADILESKLASAKEDAVKDYLSSKTGAKTKGDGTSAQSMPEQPKSWNDLSKSVAEKMRAYKDKI